MRYFNKATRTEWLPGIHEEADTVVELAEDHLFFLPIPTGMALSFDVASLPILIPLERPSNAQLTQQLIVSIDAAADTARRAVAGDPLRAVEYERAASEAKGFAAANYQGEVPPMVAAWAIGGRTAQQAADSILAEAAQYNLALVQLRTVRLTAKELIRAAMIEGNIEQAEDIAAETIASIEAAVAGIGNNPGV